MPVGRTGRWPMADFIVGNPPFVGGKDIRSRMGDGYTEALWAAHKAMNDSADFVMYWWDRAADLLVAKGTMLRRFGFVTTNSITQVFQRRVVERHLSGTRPISLLFAISDHPWTKASKGCRCGAHRDDGGGGGRQRGSAAGGGERSRTGYRRAEGGAH